MQRGSSCRRRWRASPPGSWRPTPLRSRQRRCSWPAPHSSYWGWPCLVPGGSRSPESPASPWGPEHGGRSTGRTCHRVRCRSPASPMGRSTRSSARSSTIHGRAATGSSSSWVTSGPAGAGHRLASRGSPARLAAARSRRGHRRSAADRLGDRDGRGLRRLRLPRVPGAPGHRRDRARSLGRCASRRQAARLPRWRASGRRCSAA